VWVNTREEEMKGGKGPYEGVPGPICKQK